MTLVGAGCAVYGVVDGDRLIAVKGAALAVGGAVKIGEFGYGASGIWCKVVVIFCVKHLITPAAQRGLKPRSVDIVSIVGGLIAENQIAVFGMRE